MSQQDINYGTTPNDGTGDTLRNAAIKINSNFSETYQTSSLAYTSANNINGVNITQNTNISSAQSYANGAFEQANSAAEFANGAFEQANSAAEFANGAFAQANSAAQTIPQNAQTGDYTLTLSDAGDFIYYNGSQNTTLYIPTTANVAFSNGTVIMIVSETSSSANVTINANSGVSLYLAGNTTSSNRNVTTFGVATLLHVKANTWFVYGTGIV